MSIREKHGQLIHIPEKRIKIGNKYVGTLGCVISNNTLVEYGIKYETRQGETLLFTIERSIFHPDLVKWICHLNKDWQMTNHNFYGICTDKEVNESSIEQINIKFWLDWMGKNVDSKLLKDDVSIVVTATNNPNLEQKVTDTPVNLPVSTRRDSSDASFIVSELVKKERMRIRPEAVIKKYFP